MATMPEELTVAADAADLLSLFGDGFDRVVLKVAEEIASKRSESPRVVKVADIKEAIGVICKSLEESLQREQLPDEPRSAIQQFIGFLQGLGAKC